MRTFAAIAYLAFNASFLYFMALVTGFLPPRPAAAGWIGALAIDAGLVALFGVTHSVMARGWWKRRLATVFPPAAERSLYVLVASAEVALLCWQWRPVPGPSLWSSSGPLATALTVVQLIGFGVALLSSFLIDHFELFGLRQAFAPRREETPLLRTPALYRVVRHPLYFGMLMALWAAPQMSLARFVLAAGLTMYVVVGARLEERDLTGTFGEAYRRYQREVPMLVPLPRFRR